jgi:hypothetical protein
LPPPGIAGIIIITTTIIAANKEVIVFILLCNMKDISFYEYTPADFKNKELMKVIFKKPL